MADHVLGWQIARFGSASAGPTRNSAMASSMWSMGVSGPTPGTGRVRGDGFLATFDGPTRAVRCATRLTQRMPELGIEV
jgi:class 3 adenylate cyclase